MRDRKRSTARAALSAAAMIFILSAPCVGQEARAGGALKESGHVPAVSLCELIRRPRPYHGKLVRVSAIQSSGYHGGYLYGVCGGKTQYLSLSYDCDGAAACAELESALSSHQRGHPEYGKLASRVGVLALGRFYGPVGLGGPSPSGSLPSDFVALTTAGCGYGHLGGFDYALEVRAYERTWPVPAREPWGDTREDKIEKEVLGLDFEWQLAVRDGRVEKLDAILADGYTLTEPDGRARGKARLLSDLKNPGEPLRDFIPRCERFRRSGRIGVVSGLLTNELSVEEGEPELVVRYTNVYERVRGARGWRLLSTRLSALPE